MKTMATKTNSKVRIRIPKKQLEIFCEQYQIQQLALFGSVLTNNFHKKSDVDVLVSFQPKARIGFITFSRMQRELSEMFKRPVDLVPMDGLKPVIRDSVLSNIKVVYAS
jgi:predicted nucleotidyltransferase